MKRKIQDDDDDDDDDDDEDDSEDDDDDDDDDDYDDDDDDDDTKSKAKSKKRDRSEEDNLSQGDKSQEKRHANALSESKKELDMIELISNEIGKKIESIDNLKVNLIDTSKKIMKDNEYIKPGNIDN
jgi:hypothetical protein